MANKAQKAAEQYGRLSWKKICARFPDRWVVMVEGDWRGVDPCRSALVVAVHETRIAAFSDTKAALERYGEGACFWTGEHLGDRDDVGRLRILCTRFR